MKRYRCLKCGFEFDECDAVKDEDGQLRCPCCGADVKFFVEIESIHPESADTVKLQESGKSIESADLNARGLADIVQMAISGEAPVSSMGIKDCRPCWDDILILGAQLCPMPLDNGDDVNTQTIIGRHAKKPLVLESPVYVSHMSFGSLSREVKIALARGSAQAKTAMCSGEGGILPEERAAAGKYIFEYVPNKYSVTPENLKNVDAIEIKIGQGTKPGLGGQLPGDKVTDEIAAVRGKEPGKEIHSPSKFAGIETPDDLMKLINGLREESEGCPIGVKIAAGRIEQDLAFCVYAKPDYITIDGRGGGTGASPKLVRDATSVPTIYALSRARKYLDAMHSDISLVITGGLRVASDFAKALAMGADAIAIATAALMAAGCQQFRICHTGRCPMGITTQDPELRAHLDIDVAAQRVANFFKATRAELKSFARLTGHTDIHDLNLSDLCTINREISEHTSIPHA